MPLTNHDLILLGAVVLAAFIGARLGSGGKSDAAGIARMEQRLNNVLAQLGGDQPPQNASLSSVPPSSMPPSPAPPNPAHPGIALYASPADPQQIIGLLQQGRKIDAIKAYRRQHPGVGLKDAKDAVEQVEQTLH